eukprot:TRINITY_DN29400_c0_g1_i10.p1 TRINITY_DN29400_c0_g1~~TRINITY_DN29400_c0_g1_i10.p1  ORF type:complete len:477 (-),score=77.04 TRINITY_DN29400_c0_g1_i10:736-2097(-)
MDDLQVRRRRPVNGHGDTSTSASYDDESEIKSRKSTKIDQSFTKLIFAVCAVIFLLGGVCTLFPESFVVLYSIKMMDWTLLKLGISSKLYAVVLDAGSTGSRVLVYTFYENPMTKNLLLVDEVWEQVKPGLSSFAENPVEGGATIRKLINTALNIVPVDHRSKTPVTLKATAGLRLLPPAQSDALINEVKSVLDGSGFDNRGVEIMSELHEGLYGWVTVNYLMDQMSNLRKSYVALDLGGGSTQITFSPKYEDTFAGSPPSFLHQVSVIRQKATIYSHSYLGLGLMAARNAVFHQNSETSHEPSAALTSSCVSQPVKWKYSTVDTNVKPSNNGFDTCMMQVKSVIDSLSVHQCEEVPTRKIAAFSYFYDRAVDAGILEYGDSAVVQVQDFLDAAKKACQTSAEPFMCVDLTYISGLLHHGYKLTADAKLGLYKQINGYTTSWALGAAFALLEV